MYNTPGKADKAKEDHPPTHPAQRVRAPVRCRVRLKESTGHITMLDALVDWRLEPAPWTTRQTCLLEYRIIHQITMQSHLLHCSATMSKQ